MPLIVRPREDYRYMPACPSRQAEPNLKHGETVASAGCSCLFNLSCIQLDCHENRTFLCRLEDGELLFELGDVGRPADRAEVWEVHGYSLKVLHSRQLKSSCL